MAIGPKITIGKDTVKKATKAVTSPITGSKKIIESSISGGGKILQGKVAEGLGDIGEGATKGYQEVATVGQRDTVNEYTGGYLDRQANAARGNLKSGLSVGMTALSVTNPQIAQFVNQILNPVQQAAQGVVTQLEGPTEYIEQAIQKKSPVFFIIIAVAIILLIAIIKKG